MKKFLLPAVALMAVSATSAFAADIPVRKAQPMMAPVVRATSWTGCYVSAGAGYGLMDNETSLTVDGVGPIPSTSPENGGRGWFGTVGGGCDYQIAPSWVIGIFGSYDWSNIKGRHVSPFPGGIYQGDNKMSDAWYVGGRIGYLVTPQFLTYFSGGYTEASFDAIDLSIFGNIPPPIFTVPGRTATGWFLGSGFEYNIGWLPGLFFKTEYRLAEYDAVTSPVLVFGAGVPTTLNEVHKTYVQTIRSELVWRWNWGP